MTDKKFEKVFEIIDNMAAGEYIDSLVARILEHPQGLSYSTDIKHAWEVVEWCMRYADGDLFLEFWQDGEWFICNTNLYSRRDDHSKFGVVVIAARSNRVDYHDDSLPSFPLGICRYVLKCAIAQEVIDQEVVIGEENLSTRRNNGHS